MPKSKRVKVLAMVNTLGLYPGDQVEIDRWPVVDELIQMGLLVELRPKKGARRSR